MANTSKASPMGTCQVCEQSVAWTTSTLARHPAPAGVEPAEGAVHVSIRGGVRIPASFPDGRYVCAGSYRPPTEADVPARPMTADERRLSRKLMG